MVMTDQLVEAYTNALRAMQNGAPKNLVRRAQLEGEEINPDLDVSEKALRQHLAHSNSDPDDKLRLDLHYNLAKWDSAPIEGNEWTAGTAPGTEERARIFNNRSLQLDNETASEM